MSSTQPRRFAALAAVAAATVALCLVPAAAQASTPDSAAGQSCWHDVDSGASACFTTGTTTPAQAIADATGGSVVAAPTGSSPVSNSGSGSSPRITAGAATSYLITVLYDGTSKSGNSSSYFTQNSSICAGIINQFPSLPAFNDRAESFQSYNGCRTTLWGDSNFNGTQYGPLASSNSLGSFANTASSMIVTG